MEKLQVAYPFSSASYLQNLKVAMPESLLAFESLRERRRDMQFLTAPGTIDFSKLATDTNLRFAGVMSEAEKIAKSMSGQFRAYESAVDSSRITGVVKGLESSIY